MQYSNGIVDFHEEHCIGCGYCIAGCPFDIPRISKKDHKAYKCTLCSDRVAVGLEPACIKACPTGALVFGTKEDMKHHAAERVEDLKSRGFEHAGCTIRPALAARMSCMCSIMPISRSSTTICQPIRRSAPWSACGRASASRSALAGMRVTALAGFFHYIRVGRNEVREQRRAGGQHGKRSAAMSNPRARDTIVRYTANERTNHWLVAIAFVLAALSGSRCFIRRCSGCRTLFGGGPWTRILHPDRRLAHGAGVPVPDRRGVEGQSHAGSGLELAAAD